MVGAAEGEGGRGRDADTPRGNENGQRIEMPQRAANGRKLRSHAAQHDGAPTRREGPPSYPLDAIAATSSVPTTTSGATSGAITS